MEYLTIYANAKINLTLDALYKRDDGYHEMEMVMQTVELNDVITIRKLFTNHIKLVSNIKWLPLDERNLVYRACKALMDEFNIDSGVYAEIEKQIPMSAGLGGGSADCAAALVGMRKLFNLDVSNERLLEIGKSLGADVPYCLTRGTVLAKGIGEKLTRLNPCPQAYVVIVRPSLVISTGEVFAMYKPENITKRPDTQAMIKAIDNDDIHGVANNLSNVLESVTAKQFRIIEDLKEALVDKGALGSVMSGSGPSVFGLFDSRDKAMAAVRYIRLVMPVREVYLTNIFNPGRNDFYER
ncbi:MAG: 4-(cytidine 5'-diphospho)-2-C-methyl-D-erythritol kinase [Clostridiales bacterium]|jgi:4-diphosphocytidyl-2-C-methyl-D-erythritol kinase|nr:4-(cytidine 5'-diphospho)-2-C-methyl-D-erythritol kinase [Clostridiales bacterium]